MGPDVGRSAWPLVTQPSQHTLGPTASRSPDAKAVMELRPVGHRGGHLRFIVSTRRHIFKSESASDSSVEGYRTLRAAAARDWRSADAHGGSKLPHGRALLQTAVREIFGR